MEINCLYFKSLDSTHTWSKENYKSFDPQKLTLVVAEEQTAGRGRHKRPWISPAGQNIYATFTFFTSKERTDIKNITQITALSIVKTLDELHFNPLIKWPNDILLSKKKVSGILCETIIDENQLIIMVGIGLNINMPLEILLRVSQPATSLMVESGEKFQISKVLLTLQNHFAKDISLFLNEGFTPFLEDYRKHLLHKTGDLLILDQQEGLFKKIDDDGALVMALPGHREQKFYTGEIS